jgi:hypothetical protein
VVGLPGLPQYNHWEYGYASWIQSSGVETAKDNLSNEIYVPCVLMWHIATCYCELAQQCDDQGFSQRTGNDDAKKYHCVATYLSKYCAYLVASAPGLLPGGSDTTKRAMYAGVREVAIWSVHKFADRLRAMKDFDQGEFRLDFHRGLTSGNNDA